MSSYYDGLPDEAFTELERAAGVPGILRGGFGRRRRRTGPSAKATEMLQLKLAPSSEVQYRVARVPKGNGTYREICIPSAEAKKRLRKLLPVLDGIRESLDRYRVNYAFEKGRNCALNALQHIGYRWTLSFDLADFFDSVVPRHVSDVLPAWLVEQCFVNGAAKQGLPTSPLIATIAFLPCDSLIVEHLHRLGVQAVYTRYADDLVFSFDNPKDAGKIKMIVRQVVERRGFKLNERKTKLQDARNGRIIVNGIAIDEAGLHATRRTKKRLRAALHQQNATSATGLVEWSRCKLPVL